MPIVGIAGLGAVADAILAVVVLLAILGMAYLVERFGQYIPLIGGWLAAQAVRFITAARDGLAYFYKAELWALQSVVNGIIIAITYPLGKVLDVANVSVTALYWLRNVWVPRWTNYAIDFANRIALAAYAYSLTLYHGAIAYATQVLQAAYAYSAQVLQAAYAYGAAVASAAYAYSLALYHGAIAYAAAIDASAQAGISALATFVVSELANLRTWVTGLVGTAVSGLETDIVTAEQRLEALIQAYAAAAVKDAITITDEASAVALTDIWPHLVTDVDALLDAIPKTLIDIRDDIAAIPRTIPGSLLDALSALGVLAIPLLRYLRECGVPMCRDLHGLSDLFGDLNSVATDAALLGLLVEAARNPHAAADTILSVIGPVAHGAASATKDLLGV